MNREAIRTTVSKIVNDQPITDIHTHLYTPKFGTPDPNPTKVDTAGLLLWGVDELLTCTKCPELKPSVCTAGFCRVSEKLTK